jgi:ribosome biogenesis GTPase
MSTPFAALPPQFVSPFHACERASPRALSPARVVRTSANRADVSGPAGEASVIVPRDLLADAAARPVTGDWVAVDLVCGVVHAVLPRGTALVRQAAGRPVDAQVIAANVDVAFVVTALDGDFSPRRIERYLTMVRHGDVEPVVLLTKAARCGEVDARVRAARAVAGGAPVHAIDVVHGVDAEAPRAYLGPGVTGALLGSSGVGKSTLVNHLVRGAAAAIGDVRASDGKGRHTTTRRELHVLENGAALIDTPGMRELALYAGEDALEASFADVAATAASCRFRDCAHDAEPGCAVREALARGELDEERLESLRALRRELGAQAARVAAREKRSRARSGARELREAMARKYGRER